MIRSTSSKPCIGKKSFITSKFYKVSADLLFTILPATCIRFINHTIENPSKIVHLLKRKKMKKNNFCSFIIAATALLFVLSACKKDKSLSKTEILTTGKWKITAMSVSPAMDADGDGDLDSDLYILLEPCEKDNYSVFKTDGTIENNEGPTKCDPQDPQTHISTWSLKNNENILEVDGDDHIIEELNANNLRLKFSEFGDTYTFTLQKF